MKQLSRQKRTKHNKIVLLAKTKLSSMQVLISKSLIDSYICHDELILVNNLLREYNEMKEKIKNPKTSV